LIEAAKSLARRARAQGNTRPCPRIRCRGGCRTSIRCCSLRTRRALMKKWFKALLLSSPSTCFAQRVCVFPVIGLLFEDQVLLFLGPRKTKNPHKYRVLCARDLPFQESTSSSPVFRPDRKAFLWILRVSSSSRRSVGDRRSAAEADKTKTMMIQKPIAQAAKDASLDRQPRQV
jgi:hypothetical protein